MKSNKRKVDLMAEEVDEIYDSIKRLYSEENVEEVLVNVRPSCSSEARQNPEERGFTQIQAVSATWASSMYPASTQLGFILSQVNF